MVAAVDDRSTLSETKVGPAALTLLTFLKALWVPRIENSILQMIGTEQFSITSIFGLFASRTFLACSGCTDDRRRSLGVRTPPVQLSCRVRLSHATLPPPVPALLPPLRLAKGGQLLSLI